MSGCGKLFKGTHKDDDAIPCGTNLTFGVGREPQVTEVWLCDKCALTYENGEEAKP